MNNKDPYTLTDLSTNKSYDVHWLNFPPFRSNPEMAKRAAKINKTVISFGNCYWPEFIIKEDYVPGRIWDHKDKLWEDKVFILRCSHSDAVNEYVKIQIYWNDKYPGYLTFRPITIESNLEILKRLG